MRQHKIIVVPSRYQEPIGIICLEAIACGCLAIGSSGGGLAESVGPCGLTFPNGDVEALTKAMIHLIQADQKEILSMQQAAEFHLQKYYPAEVAGRYLAALQEACKKHVA